MLGYVKQLEVSVSLLDKIRQFFCGIIVEQFEQGIVIKIPINQKRTEKVFKKMVKKIQKFKINTLVFSNGTAFFQEQFVDKLNQLNSNLKVDMVDGRNVIEYMQFDIWGYILKLQGKNISQEDIFFLIKKDTKLDLAFLTDFIKQSKTVNIVTNDIERFKKIQENLYENENILISVSNNKAKALKKARYIFNVNMNKKEIAKFKINKYAIILNVREKFKYDENGFQGININNIKIKMPDEYMEKFEKVNNNEKDLFDNTKLYETILLQQIQNENAKSLIKTENNIKNMYFELAKNIIKKDEIKISKLVGNNGEIGAEEIIKNKNIYETILK